MEIGVQFIDKPGMFALVGADAPAVVMDFVPDADVPAPRDDRRIAE